MTKLDLPQLSSEQAYAIDAPITEAEVRAAVRAMKAGKSPGIDGFPKEYYKHNLDLLAPILTELYSEAALLGCLPESFYEALISLILKKDKDLLHPGSFRPVSLVNVDCKILTKILSARLEKVLPLLIHPDQVGFVKGRFSSDNLRGLFHLIWQAHGKDVAAFSLDAEKAFDRVEWSFLLCVLEKIGFGKDFLRWIRIIYAKPSAAMVTNGLICPFFRLFRGTKSGDPMSPILFTLVIEPLAAAIRKEASIKGVVAGGREHKLFLYATDILCLVLNLASSTRALLDKVDLFSQISGYKVNWHKSEAMAVSKVCHPAMVSAGTSGSHLV